MTTTSASPDKFLPVSGHVRRIVAWMTESVYEKDQLAAMALLCAVAGENIFLLGPPGTAKSLVARRLKGVLKGARSFEYLMSRFSTPDEIFGPVSIMRLKESDSYERLTDGYLPTADVVFLDEIWKAGPSIQNTLLTAINEHLYHNGTVTMRLPMKVLIAASNELPAKNEGLEALWDRFLVRMVSNCIESDDNFEKMLLAPELPDTEIDDDIAITAPLYESWCRGAREVTSPPDIIAALKWLRRSLMDRSRRDDEQHDSADYYVSDRRWKKIFRLMQASAFLNGRKEMDLSDLLLLIHCLWNSPDAREEINRCVTSSLWHDTMDSLQSIGERLRELVTPADGARKQTAQFISESDFKEFYNSYFAVDGFTDGTALIPRWDYNKLSLIDETDGIVFNDHSLRMQVIQIEKSNTVFSLPSNTGRPRRVKLLKCNGGVVVNSIPYALIRKGQSAGNPSDTTPGLSCRKEAGSLRRNFNSILKAWTARKKQLSGLTAANIFVSALDVEMLSSAISNVDRLATETEIRLNNVERIVR
ncbi:MAG: AAA domain-containing protein [Bacteroidales bacterium]|nr:AAA domain-containing protein [Bacteroidales bacterium]